MIGVEESVGYVNVTQNSTLSFDHVPLNKAPRRGQHRYIPVIIHNSATD